MIKMKEIKIAIFVLAMSSTSYMQGAHEVTTFNNNANSEFQSNDKFENGYVNVFESDSVVWKHCLELNVEGYENPIGETILYGDTLINGLNWKIFTQFSSIPIGQFRIKGLIRTEGAKVIFKPCPGSENHYMADYMEETVIYDFSLEIGDSFFPWGNVTKIDSIELNDGEKHKRLHFGGWTCWIEGLGNDTYDPFFMLFPTPTMASIPTLMCCHVNGKLLYLNPDYLDCDGNKVDNESIENQEISVLLNGKYLHINGLFEQSYLVTIYSINGTPLLQQTGGSSSIIMQLSDLSSGVYIVNINSDKRSISRKIYMK